MDKKQPETKDALYEKKEINARAVLIAGLIFVIIAVVVHVLMWLEFSMMDTKAKALNPRVSPLLPARQTPPGPNLEAKSPVFGPSGAEPFNSSSLAVLRAEEKNQLDSYAWVDEKSGVVRIPIEEAMKRIVEMEKQKQSGSGSQTETAED